MTPLTRCDLRRRTHRVLHPGLVMGVLLLSGAISGLFLLQAHLRFMSRDLMIETRKLQSAFDDLKNRRNRLVSEVEELSDLNHLSRYAEEELGLRRRPADHTHRGVVSAEAIERWRGPRMEMDSSYPLTEEIPEKILATVGEKMVNWSNVALARDFTLRPDE